MIKISVTSYDNAAPLAGISAVFDSKRRTMGRGEGNFLVLPDAKHEVARLQAGIWSDGTRHTLVNLSQATPMLLNGKEIPSERETDIHVGDRIQVGPYLLGVEQGASASLSATPAPAVAPAPAATPAPAAAVAPSPVTAAATPVAPAAAASVQAPAPAPQAAAMAPAAAPLHATPVSPVASAPLAPTAAAPAATASSPAATPAAAPIFASPAASAPPSAPVSAPMPPLAAVATPAPSAPASVADLQALKDAFLQGAGLPGAAMAGELTPEFMEMLGQMMAASIQGTIELMAHRTLVKQEVKTDLTVVVLRENNPLKFFPDAQTVMMQMLRKKMPGFMAPTEAVKDAFHDLRGHQLAVVAGMRANIRASVDAVLARLRPENFADGLGEPGLVDSLVPSKRPAAMWVKFRDQYDSVAGAPSDEFKNVFGTPFQAAYEKEVERHDRELPRA